MLLLLLACSADPSESPATAPATAECEHAPAIGWTEASHQKADGDYNRVFPRDHVQRLDLTVCASDFAVMVADLQALLGDMAGGPPDGGPPDGGPPDGGPPEEGGELPEMDFAEPVFVPATLSYEGATWPSVGLRFKGNSSLLASFTAGITKLPLRIDMDQYEDTAPETDDQRFYGFQKLSFGPGYADDSYLRQALTDELMEAAGLPAPRSAFYELWLDSGEGPVYWGLYTMVEDPENTEFLDRAFGDDEGNLYQPENGCADWTCFDEESFSKETQAEAGDWSDVEAAITALNTDDRDEAAWRAGLEAELDVDGFLRWLALSTAIGNWDSYGLMPHNYFLYADPGNDGRLAWIPWDHNMSLSDGMKPLLSLGLTEVGEDWPLIRRLMDNPTYAARYREHLADLAPVLDADKLSDRARSLHTLIAPYAEAEAAPLTQLSDFAAFEASVDGESGLGAWMEERSRLVEAYLGQ